MQLDLFLNQKPDAQVFIFPPARRVDLIRSAAAELANRDYESGKRFWTKHTKALSKELRDAGASRDQIAEMAADYSKAVRLHLLLINSTSQAR